MSKRPRNFDARILRQQKQLDAWFSKSECTVNKEEGFEYSEELKSPVRRSPRKMSTSHEQSQEHLSYAGFSEAYDSSILDVMKEELDIYHNIGDIESIEMTHDFNDIIVSPKSLKNNLHEYSPSVGECLKVELETDDGESMVEEQNDPLHISKNDRRAILKELYSSEEMKQCSPQHSSKQLRMSEKICVKQHKGIQRKRKSMYRPKEDEDEEWHSSGISDQDDEERKEKVKDESHSLSKNELKFLRCLLVDLKHDIPPQHNVERGAGTHSLSMEEQEEFQQYGRIKSGTFSSKEDQQLKENWRYFCEVHDWNVRKVQPFLRMRHKGKYLIPSIHERKNFVKFLARGLSWRTLHSVYSRFKILFNSDLKKGPYSLKDDRTILSRIHKSLQLSEKDAITELASALRRSRRSVHDRLIKLQNKQNLSASNKVDSKDETQNHCSCSTGGILDKTAHETASCTVVWTVALVEKFIQTLLHVTGSDSLDQLECEMIKGEIWKEMEKIMSINHITLQKFWYLQLYMQLFSPKPIIMNQIKMELLNHLHELDVKAVEEIEWETLVQNFDGVTPYFLSLLLENLMLDAQSKMKACKESDIFEYLYVHWDEMKRKNQDFVLPKLYLSENKIIRFDKRGKDLIYGAYNVDPFNINQVPKKCT